MTTGLSGTFAANNTNFNQYPDTHKWVERTSYGVDGGAHPVYARPRSYEMTWNLISPANAQQLINFYNLVGNTGTLVTCLPEWGQADYRFKNYSGTTWEEPQMGGWFMGFLQDFRLLILDIDTNQ